MSYHSLKAKAKRKIKKNRKEREMRDKEQDGTSEKRH
jgi:hypothetical protein